MSPIAITFGTANHPTFEKFFHRNGIRFDEPTFHESERRNEGILGITERHNIFRAFGNVAVGQVALKPSRLCTLRAVQINIMHCHLFDPRDNARNIVKVRITAGPQCMKRLLQQGGAAFSVGRDNNIGWVRVVGGDRRADFFGNEYLAHHATKFGYSRSAFLFIDLSYLFPIALCKIEQRCNPVIKA